MLHLANKVTTTHRCVSEHTIFQMTSFTHSKDMTGAPGTVCHKALEIAPFGRAHTRFYWPSIVYLYLAPFLRCSEILIEIAHFKLFHLYLVSSLGVTALVFHLDLLHQKTRVRGLLCGVVCVILLLAVLACDRDGQTVPQHIPQFRSNIASRGKSVLSTFNPR